MNKRAISNGDGLVAEDDPGGFPAQWQTTVAALK
jgi:hypothetical protein